MMIRILPKLENAEQWHDFIQREQRYCFVNEPETLVDLQSNHLMITLLNKGVRNGRQAIKYSIGAKTSADPIKYFIAHCRFSLSFMLYLLEQLDFSKTVLDYDGLGNGHVLSIRRFFAREREILSPSLLSNLAPLSEWPARWSLGALLSLLANHQYHYLYGSKTANQNMAPRLDGLALLLNILDKPSRYRVRTHEEELLINRDGQPFAVLMPKLPGALPRPVLQAPEVRLTLPPAPVLDGRDYLN